MNKRRLRRMLGLVLPEGIKKHLRARLFGYRSSTAGADWSLTERGGNVVLNLNGVEAIFPESARGSLKYHCFDNGDSVEELHGFMRDAIGRPGTLIDVGAADGLFSTLFCRAAPGNRAVAYEPSGELYKHLASIVNLNNLADRITMVNAAVGQSTGMLAGSLNAAGMLLTNTDSETSMQIPMVCLDDQFEGLGKPTAIKIDVEGFEGEVLRGARRLLAAHKPTLFLEFHLDLLEQQGVRAADLLQFLVDLRYQFETSLGAPLSLRQIADSAKAIIRFVARAG